MKIILIFVVCIVFYIFIYTPFNYWDIIIFCLGIVLGRISPKLFARSKEIHFTSPDRKSEDFLFKK
ncbi:MAG: hypothetical protein US04_C0001G0527 [Candidatus Nomurabacteria bacterium GW2011_GWD2_36_14]|nr:MAG: hypothetical protein UR97_C0002G0156 [Candidatus Nomurabacteria bacterium GW2011_GWE2_36_115]KKP94561.1 MAG: hypothetical protein US00_C0001G0155 [Candidatus Nomurabacteria bacterium GW2011_GWF2_36_126]KKP97024.1 MAG: hypothetical protein US04_C0001G0527 [Candidatus Nomurabacteria bacterium GW2011_GWD2_36_14]KKP99372.1 MAG: hypothetical protein US08_C0001G0054 [Candidatus Nomurabacteria bacterium GW2011_GWF2_36_19]KKQ05771.1 MAG: hypothetical protein US17_C0002G0155 [Candidatus Nomuraba